MSDRRENECVKCHTVLPLIAGFKFNFCPTCGYQLGGGHAGEQNNGSSVAESACTITASSPREEHENDTIPTDAITNGELTKDKSLQEGCVSENNSPRVPRGEQGHNGHTENEPIEDSSNASGDVERLNSVVSIEESDTRTVAPAGDSNPPSTTKEESTPEPSATKLTSPLSDLSACGNDVSSLSASTGVEQSIQSSTNENDSTAVEVRERTHVEEDADSATGHFPVITQPSDSEEEITDTGESRLVKDSHMHSNGNQLTKQNLVKTSHNVIDSEIKSTTNLADTNNTSVDVTFHTMIQISAWNWNDGCMMTIRFGDPRLGNWANDTKQLSLKRKYDDGLAEFQCTIQIPLDLTLNKAIPYRYIVHSGCEGTSVDQCDAPYEFLTFDDVAACRCMVIEELNSEGQYDQFDGITQPEPKSWFGSRALKYFTTKSQEPSDKGLQYCQEKSMVHYLEDVKATLTNCELSETLSIHFITRKILHIYNQLFLSKVQELQQNAGPGEKVPIHARIAKNLPEIFKNWLLSTIKVLQKKVIKTAEDNAQRMASVITVVLCFVEVMPRPLPLEALSVTNYSTIMKMFSPMVDTISRKSLDLEMLLKLIHPHEDKVADGLLFFAKHLAHTKHLKCPDWFYVVPLIHFLLKQSSPFEKPEKSHSKIQWDDPNLELAKLRKEITARRTDIRVTRKCFKELKPLCVLDPLFFPLFILLCPEKELPELFLDTPLYLSSAFTLMIVPKAHSMSEMEVVYFVKIFRAMLDVVKQQSEDSDLECLESAFESSRKLFMHLMQILPRQSSVSSSAIEAAASLLFYTITMLKVRAPDEELRALVEEQTKELLLSVHKEVIQWIQIKFGKIFGSPAGMSVLLCAYEELELCQVLYRLDCPQLILESWQAAILQTIKERVKLVPRNKRIDLFCVLEKQKVVEKNIITIFMEAAMESLHQMEVVETAQGVEKLYSGTSRRREAVGKILESIILLEYPLETNTVSLDQLLEWELWPVFIKIYSNEPKSGRVASCLPEHCALLSACAQSVLLDICMKLSSGDVIVLDLRKMSEKRTRMEKLCSVTSVWKGFKKQHPKDHLAQRLNEYDNYKARHDLLTFLCSQVTVDVIGLDELRAELRSDYCYCPINALCTSSSRNGPIQYYCCESATPLEPIMVKFRIMAGENDNDVFKKIWLKTLNNVRRATKVLTLEGIVSDLWEPAYQECQLLLDHIKDRTILLIDVDQYFIQYRDKNQIITHLFSLFRGVEMCENNKRPNSHPAWLQIGVHLMVQYWKLCQYAKAAKVVLDVSEKLKVTGDFSLMRTLATKGTFHLKSNPLSSIDEALIDTGSFLEDFRDEEKLDCLRKFVDSVDIIEWIRTYTKEVNDLHRFVSIALHTSAGEGDYESDKLATLRTVGTAFEPLIYGLKGDITYEIFCEKCRSVWDELSKNPRLPQMLITCNEELEWYKSLKDSQDSVTSYGEMNNILKHGVFKVGSNNAEVVRHLHKIVSVKLKTTDRRIVKRAYNFTELQDLESKLVLITGSKARNRGEVDLFLDIFHGVYRVADALLSLQMNGNMTYLGWVMEVVCKPDTVEELAKEAKSLEDELQIWKEKVELIRTNYYEVNYFTTMQLIILRKDLGLLKSAHAKVSAVSQTVIALLQSVSNNIASETVLKVVREIESSPQHSHSFASSVPVQENGLRDDEGCSIDRHGDDTSNSNPSKSSATSTQRQYVSAVSKLSNKQKEILVHVVERFGFPQQLVLLAFENCKGEINKYDVQNWCIENAEKYQFQDENTDEETADVPEDDPPSSPPSEASTSVLSWVGHSLMHYITPLKRHNRTKDGQTSPHIPKRNLPSSISVDNKRAGLTIFCNSNVDESYLSLEHLGIVLKHLRAPILYHRPFKETVLKVGSPNLIVTSPGSVLKSVLTLYMEDKSLPLPSLEEVLICNSNTTAEEVTLLWIRSVREVPSHSRIFCLVHAERLSYQVSDRVLHSLADVTQGRSGYRLVIFCSNDKDSEEKSHIISKLHRCRRQFPEPRDDKNIESYLKAHFTAQLKSKMSHHAMAASVDNEKSCVRVITSDHPGMGKSFYIQQMAESLRATVGKTTAKYSIIPIHGPEVTSDTVMNFLNKYVEHPPCSMYHVDIASDVLWKVDSILFSVLILRGLTDSRGIIWRTQPSHYFVIEATLPAKGNDKTSSEQGIVSLLSLLPSVHCLSPSDVVKVRSEATPRHRPGPIIVSMNKHEFRSHQFQRVYQYLSPKRGNIDTFHFGKSVEGNEQDCLNVLIRNCGIKNPSWREIKHFVEFLNIQLKSCEHSVYCNQKLVGDVLTGMKSFVVRFMITMSKDFATPSLEGEVTRGISSRQTELHQYQIVSRRLWEHSVHPYIFFNQTSDGTITFVGFKVTPQGNLVHPVDGRILQTQIMSAELFSGLQQNGVDFSEDYTKWQKSVMVQKMTAVMGVEASDPDKSYVLTMDNMIKILALYMRFRCNIPVVIMGETGCGKTRLIRYMSELIRQGRDVKNMFILKIHGGTTVDDVMKFLYVVEDEAKTNSKQDVDTIAFFDEANTTDALGLIKEVMCDRRVNGRRINKHIKFIAACNPYRKHSDRMIEKLKGAGLGFYVRENETTHKLGGIPLRHLVYRVLDLPPSMRPLVYDFGQLKSKTESQYIFQVVSNHMQKHRTLRFQDHSNVKAISNVLMWSQDYMRMRQDECSFVSLRDVERAMIVLAYFYDHMEELAKLIDKQKEKETGRMCSSPSFLTRSLLLSLSVCYHARLQNRLEYEQGVAKQFQPPLILSGGAIQLRNEIKWCQEVLLDNMRLGENIAKNAALRENVFMMTVCVDLRIPLFVVGKPGSSKSLAKSIVQESMKGKSSRNKLMKQFKEVDVFSYQCSQLSTSESIIDVFNTAKKLQQKQDVSRYVAVVVLDEVGLAEDSPNLPLKALHPLLEDGTSGGGEKGERSFQDKVVNREERVGFIGISNWALDPAKMNRGVMVTRGDPSEKELELSARGICSNKENDPVRERLEEFFHPLAKSYIEICQKQHRQFFGLRDFYSLIKMLYWMCDKSESQPTWQQLEHAIRRNFGGLDGTELDPLEVFKQNLPSNESPDLSQVKPNLRRLLNPDCSKLGLIKASLTSTERTWHGENRYLLFLTENYVALDILKHFLSDLPVIQDSELNQGQGQPVEVTEPFVLFGSSFPKDKEYTQVCRNINQIKVCMETGRTVILLNLENLYESLYDVLNQYYVYNFGNRYVDLGLQTHRVRCRVHDNFKLILIAEKSTVYNHFPTPLVNRLEKHFVLTSSILEDWQINVLNQFQDWIKKFSDTRDKKFRPENAFIGYQTDTPAAIIFQTTNFLRKLRKQEKVDTKAWEVILAANATQTSLEEFMVLPESSEEWNNVVLKLSQYHLLQIASPDAIVRLRRTELATKYENLQQVYFGNQYHGSLESFLNHQLSKDQVTCSTGLLLQVTTHSHLLSYDEISQLKDMTRMAIVSLQLHEFETELDFCNKIGPHFKQEAGQPVDMLLLIQCDSSYISNDLVACARYRIYDERAHNERKGTVHIVFLVFVPHSNSRARNQDTIGYLGDPWVSAHIDDLRPNNNTTVTPQLALGLSINEVFMGKPVVSDSDRNESKDAEPHLAPRYQISPLHGRLQDCIQASSSKLEDVSWRRTAKRIEILVGLIPRSTLASPDKSTFHGILIDRIAEVMRERDLILDPTKRWVIEEAMNLKKLHTGGTFGNVLARKVDEVIVPIFAYIISVIDRFYNLDLIFSTERCSNSSVSQLWLALFRDSKALPFSYDEIAAAGERLPGAGSRKSEQDFKCQLPFSWIIKDTAEALWKNAKSTSGNDLKELQSQLAESIGQTRVGTVISTFSEANSRLFSQYYLHDFIRMVHNSKHKKCSMVELEYELITDSLDRVIQAEHGDIIATGNSLLHFVAALHVVYDSSKSRIAWFSQLVSFSPGIMLSMKERCSAHEHEVVLHLVTVDKLLYELQPPLKKDHLSQNLIPWLNDLRLCQNTINSILSLSPLNQWIESLNQMWQFIQAMRMFLEHIMLRHSKVSVKYARRLEIALKQCGPDFLKASTLQKVIEILRQIDRELRSKSSQQHKHVILSCRNFFMEVVSILCFGGESAPEPQLIKCLMETVFARNSEGTMFSTRDITPYDHESSCDEVPVVRSFLLQLLLEHNSAAVRMHLQDYFTQSCQALGSQTVDLNLCLLCIQCFEDALSRSISDTISEHKLKDINEIMNEGFAVLLSEFSDNISVQLLEAVARVRFSLSVVADMLERLSSKQKSQLSSQAKQLVYTSQNICTDLRVNVIDTTGKLDTTGPVVYLMRLLVRQYGMPVLERVADACTWVIPRELKDTKQGDEKLLDQFVLYNEYGYANFRECLDSAAYGKDMNPLLQSTDGITTEETAILLLAVYRKVTLSRIATSQPRQIVPDILTKLDTHLSRLKSINNEMKRIARMLIANDQGRNFVCLNVLPRQSQHLRTLATFIIHTAVVLSSKSGHLILLPFISILQNPSWLKAFLCFSVLHSETSGRPGRSGDLIGHCCGSPPTCPHNKHYTLWHTPGCTSVETRCVSDYYRHLITSPDRQGLPDFQHTNAYLPTMPEDSLSEVRQAALGGQFYECPKGHPYFVGECGRPMQEYSCNICGARIGGRNHNLRNDNRTARANDATKTGHDLGKPSERPKIPSPERLLSPLAVSVIRALMHAAFVWTTSNNDASIGDVATLIKPAVNPNGLAEYFWKHLEKDLEGICAILKKGEDESVLLLHLVLKEILTQKSHASIPGNGQLRTKVDRRNWEAAFNETFVRPVTEALDQKIHAAFNSVLNDNEQEHDQLFYLVYERIQVSRGSIFPHMWSFQSKITLEDLSQKVQEKSIQDGHPILHEFLQAEANLRATQHLPDIVYLQCCLFDAFNLCIDRSDAKKMTIGQYVARISNDCEKEKFRQGIESLNKAWQLVVHKLKTHGRLRVKDEYLIPAFTDSTPLEYIIPTTVDAGACTMALVDFLTLTHNDFIERCQTLMSDDQESVINIPWSKHKIPITHVNQCHLVIYEQQLQSIILSHCHYSLTAGKSHVVTYDFKALEKTILDRFIHGKPIILADIPQVIYRKDSYNAATFGAIRRKVSPQERLSVRFQQEILTELHTLERVRDMLDVVDIVLGFLSSGGGSADKPLGEYVEKVLKMKTKSCSQKIKQFCKLGHIVSLWETLSVDLARQLYLRGEEPFDSVKKEMLKELSKDEKKELDGSLRSFDLNLLLGILFQFIQTHVLYCAANELEWTIVDTLPAVLDQWGVPQIPEFDDYFPQSIVVSQSIAVWKSVVLYTRALAD